VSATLPSIPAGHVPRGDEWLQILNGLLRITNIQIFSSAGGCTLSTTSSSYVDVTNATLAFTKLGSSSESDIGLFVCLDMYSTVTSTGATIAANIGGTDTDAFIAYSSAGNTVTPHGGLVKITGIGAGSYTVKLRAKRTSGTGVLTVDSLCNVSFTLIELPK